MELDRKGILGILWLLVAGVNVYLRVFHGYACPSRLFNVSILIGIMAVWYDYHLVRTVLECKLWLWLSQFTFFVYAGHLVIQATLHERVVDRFLPTGPAAEWFTFLLLPPVAIGISALVAAFARRFANPVYRVFSGGR